MIDRIEQIWPWLLSGLLIGVMSLLLLWRRAGRLHSAKLTAVTARGERPATTRRARAQARDALKQACEQNDPHAAATALLELAAIHWHDSPPRNLGTVANRLQQGGGPIRELERTLYAPTDLPWNGEALWETVALGLSQPEQHEKTATEPLPPLYPA